MILLRSVFPAPDLVIVSVKNPFLGSIPSVEAWLCRAELKVFAVKQHAGHRGSLCGFDLKNTTKNSNGHATCEHTDTKINTDIRLTHEQYH